MTSDAVNQHKSDDGQLLSPEQAAATAMVCEARQRSLEVTGPDGLLKLFTKNVLETAAHSPRILLADRVENYRLRRGRNAHMAVHAVLLGDLRAEQGAWQPET